MGRMVRMLSSLTILATISAIANGQPTGKPEKPGECCETKMVGGIWYSYVGKMDTKMYNCLNPCVYQKIIFFKKGEEGAKFCFAMGEEKVECKDEDITKPPMEGSEKPPMEGSEKPPMEGSEKPPVEGSEKPPVEGSEKPPVGGSTGTTVPNPGSAATELTLSISQTWSQEPNGYSRTAQVSVPATSAGQKVPVVIHLHGNGGQGNTATLSRWLGNDCSIVSADGYERSWNIYTEKSKADDVSFIVDLIAKVGADIPAADMNNVNIIGTSNGAALTYSLIIGTGQDRPFRRAFPMVSSLISPQYHDSAFWKFTTSAAAGEANNYDAAVVPAFDDNFEYAHFHGTEDGAIKYDGQSPGPGFLGGADVIAAQKTDFLWAQAMGYTGAQLADSEGVSVGTDAKPVQSYTYLNGKVRHFKLVGEGHGTGPGHPVVQEIVRAAIGLN